MAFNFSPKIVTNGLVLHLDAANPKSYPRSGTVWRDLSRGQNNGTLVNSPTFSTSNGGIFSFNGSNNYVSFSYNSNIAFLNRSEYTLECFARPVATYPNGYPAFINREDAAIGSRDGYNLLFTEVSQPANTVFLYTERIIAGAGTGNGVSLSKSEFYNNWHHIVATYDGSIVKLYYDGVSRGTGAGTSTGNLTNNIKTLTVASRAAEVSTNASIPVVRIYNRALSADEVFQNYNATKKRFGL